LGLPATKEKTNFVGIGLVQNGQLGKTRLDGVKFAMFGRAGKSWRVGERFQALSLYLDERMTLDQRRALATIFGRDPLFQADSGTALASTMIVLKASGADPLAPLRMEVGKDAARGEIDFTPTRGFDGRNPIAVKNAYTCFDEKEAVSLGVARVRFSDH